MLNRTTFSITLLIVLLILMIFSCNKRLEKDYENFAAADSTSSLESISPSDQSITSSAAVENKKDTLRKFIRTADLKFKVKDVIQTTYKIEDITSRLGGFVTYTHLTSQINNHSITKISADSSLESTSYTVINYITIRVPNIRLDSTLKSIAPLVDYMDHRTIKADDIGLQLLSNQLSEQRVKRHEKRLTDAIDNRGKKLRETTEAEENLIYKQEVADNAMIANLSLMDQVQYSTITISLYQSEVTKKALIANEKNIEIYQAGFGTKLMESIYDGWKILEAFLLFIAQFWGLLLVGIVVFAAFRKYGYKLKRAIKK